MKLKVVLDPGAYMPERAYPEDAGLDLFTPADFTVFGVTSREVGSETVNTGVHIEIPEGYVGMVKSKSGLNINKGLTAEGVIDAGYTGSIRVKLYNHSPFPRHFKSGEKIAQLVLLPIITPDLVRAEILSETDRGNNGFGSTGR